MCPLIGLVGNYNPETPAHQAIPLVLPRAAEELGLAVSFEWVPTEEISSIEHISRFDGVWCVPGSPYRSIDGALTAIRFAREHGVPFLGTCGGFQHAVLEYARNVLGWADAEHSEMSPEAARPVITMLECSLVEVQGAVRLFPGTLIAKAYAAEEAFEGYRCRYGLNPEYQAALTEGPLRVSAVDEFGDIRALELVGHPFFVATLFQPERAALSVRRAPLVEAFVRACALAGSSKAG